MSDLLDHALAWHAAGYTPVAIAPNGQKRPAGAWKYLQSAQPTADQVRADFSRDTDGIGLICGGPTGLEMLEVESRAIGHSSKMAQIMADHGHAALWERINTGYVEASPTGGIHWYYRVDGGARGNTKLARRPGPGGRGVEVLIETRGEGGFTVIAPSAGRTHPTGNAWSAFFGGPDTVPVLTGSERDTLYALLSLLDEMPAVAPPPPVAASPRDDDRLRPGDDYNQRTTWDEILTPRGWTRSQHFGGTSYGWTRPGKHPRDGMSATTGRNDGDNLYVFSTSTEFDTERPYSKFAAYTLLEHGGDFAAAARELARLGYGEHRDPDPLAGLLGSTTSLATPPRVTLPPTGTDGEPPAAALAEPEAEASTRLQPGGAFILDIPDNVAAVWGAGDAVLWAEGEALTICGTPGVGKTTLTGQVLRARLVGGDVLGLPVTPTTSRVLYLAMDRPRQIARSLRRTLGDLPRDVLDEKLRVWPGPPIADVAAHPETLLGLVQLAGADTVIVDSIKDAAVGLSNDEVGAGYNRARQMCIAAGIEVLEQHHMVKKGDNGTKPKSLADLYGSTWIASGAGSVVLLHGVAGDPIVELIHLKQPAEPIGPYKVLHDHERGVSTVWHQADLVATAKYAGDSGITAKAAASTLYQTETPTASETEKARRKLDQLAEQGLLEKVEGFRGGASERRPATWRHVSDPLQPVDNPAQSNHESNHANHVSHSEQSRPITPNHKTAGQSNHATNHANHGAITFPAPSLEGGPEGRPRVSADDSTEEDPDDEVRHCDDCGARLGKIESPLGVCSRCRNIRRRQGA